MQEGERLLPLFVREGCRGRNGPAAVTRDKEKGLRECSPSLRNVRCYLSSNIFLGSGLLGGRFDGGGGLLPLLFVGGLGWNEGGCGFRKEVELAFAWDVDLSSEC